MRKQFQKAYRRHAQRPGRKKLKIIEATIQAMKAAKETEAA